MLAPQLLDPRLAFLLLCILLVAAAIPIAFAWARVLPEEQAPFRFHRSSERATGELTRAPEQPDSRREPFAVMLLVCVSLSYLWQLPGLPRDFVLLRIAPYVPEPWLQGFWFLSSGWFFRGCARRSRRPESKRTPARPSLLLHFTIRGATSRLFFASPLSLTRLPLSLATAPPPLP